MNLKYCNKVQHPQDICKNRRYRKIIQMLCIFKVATNYQHILIRRKTKRKCGTSTQKINTRQTLRYKNKTQKWKSFAAIFHYLNIHQSVQNLFWWLSANKTVVAFHKIHCLQQQKIGIISSTDTLVSNYYK